MNTRARVTAFPALVISAALSRSALAHEGHATPDPGDALADVGLPEMNLAVTANAVEGVPESIEAGRYLLTVDGEAAPDGPPPGVMILQLPEGMTLDEAGAQAQANPDGPPPFYYEALLAGGASVTDEGPGVSVIDLPPGEWIAAGTYFSRPPVTFSVTGELAPDLPEPPSTATFTLAEMSIEITEGELVAGDNLVKIENLGAQPHFIEIVKVPDGSTEEDAEAWLQADMAGTPVTDIDIEWVTTTPDQSGGVTQWVSLALDPGTYEALCFVPDPESGMPHAFMGMHALFEVAG